MSNQTNRNKFWFKLALVGFCIVLSLGCLVALIPTILTTKWGQSAFFDIINTRIPGKFMAESISLSWSDKQVVHGLQLYDPNENLVISIQQLTMDCPLLSLALEDTQSLKHMELTGLNGKITSNESGISNLQQALGLPGFESFSATPFDEMKLSNISAQVSLLPQRDLVFHITGEVHTKGKISAIDIDAIVERGQFAEGIKITKANIKDLPVAFIEQLAALKNPPLARALASFPEANVNVFLDQSKGKEKFLKANIKGPTISMNLDATIHQDVLILNSPFLAEFTLNPQIGESVFQEFIPLFRGLIRTENPVRIAIDPKGFSCPILESDVRSILDQIKIDSMEIDLGKAVFSDKSELRNLLFFLDSRKEKGIEVWFTPIYGRMAAGVIYLQRFDLLAANKFPVAVWGKIDLPKDHMHMTLGISGASLQSVTGISKIDKDYMMQIPLKGSIRDPNIDKTKMAAQIAALAATFAGNEKGLLIGAALGLASGSSKEEAPPPPSTQPFPWASQDEAKNAAVPSADPEKKENSSRSLKSLRKEAQKALKNLFQ
jgi:hypothetical protein